MHLYFPGVDFLALSQCRSDTCFSSDNLLVPISEVLCAVRACAGDFKAWDKYCVHRLHVGSGNLKKKISPSLYFFFLGGGGRS